MAQGSIAAYRSIMSTRRLLVPSPTEILPRAAGAVRALVRVFAVLDLGGAFPTALLCWFLTVIFSVSLAALIFRGALAPYLPFGVGMALFTAAAVGLVTTFASSIPNAIAIPSDRIAPMLALLTGGIAAGFPPGESDRLLPTCLCALVLSTLLTGLTLLLLGRNRLGQIIRFLPFPVVGGFMAGAGLLLVKGALIVATGLEITPEQVPQLFEPAKALRWIPSLAIAIALVIAARRLRHFLVVPSIMIFSVVLFYGVVGVTGLSFPQLRSIGWLPGAFPHAITAHPTFGLFFTADWPRIFHHVETLGTIVLVSALSLLMISGALEVLAHVEIDADRELQAAGLANLVSALGGGLVGFHSLSITSLALRVGPPTRWIGLLTAVGAAVTLWAGPNLVSYLPIPVLAALLLYLGLNFLVEWLVDSYQRMPRSDYLILVVVAWAGYIIAVGVGLVTAVVLFALRYSRIDVVRMELNGAQHRSNVDRTKDEAEILRDLQPAILILKLQGYIFFGTAHNLLHRVRVRAHAGNVPPLRYLFLDFRHVTGIDSSALLSFSKLLQFSRQFDFRILCTSVAVPVLASLRREPALFAGEHALLIHADLDHAMEWCEARQLAPHTENLRRHFPDAEELLQAALPGRDEIARRLVRYFTPQKIPAGAVLATQGERTRDLFLIEQGQIRAQLQTAHGESIRLRTLGAGSVVGEIGLYLNLLRTASLVAETDSVVWKLATDSLLAMERDDPQAAATLHEFLAASWPAGSSRPTNCSKSRCAEALASCRIFSAHGSFVRNLCVMVAAVFDTHRFDRAALEKENLRTGHELRFYEARLEPKTAQLAAGCGGVCVFVNDLLNRATLQILRDEGVRLIALRCAGYNQVDLAAAEELGLTVTRVPDYSPYAVAEHAVALLLALNRKVHRAYNRVRESNFSLEGLVGFDLHGKTVGIVGTGKIGAVFAKIMAGFGCRILAFDVAPRPDLPVTYVDAPRLLAESDIISLHVPLLPATHHFLNEATLAQLKPGAFVINTSRGALIEAQALINALKSGQVGGAALDVYEEETGVFFHDLSGQILQDDVLARLISLPNVLITSHQAFLTHEALANIARTTLETLSAFERDAIPESVQVRQSYLPMKK
jgi:SulP family sulfate permease